MHTGNCYPALPVHRQEERNFIYPEGGSVLEKELENYICAHPECLPGGVFEIFGRQVKTPHGVIDILGRDGDNIEIVELKAGALQEKDIGQVLRYVYDIKNILKQIGRSLYPDLPGGLLREQWDEMFCMSSDSWIVSPALIGKSASPKILAAAEGAGIVCMKWEIVGDTIEIDYIYGRAPCEIAYPGLDVPWVEGIGMIAYNNFVASSKCKFEVRQRNGTYQPTEEELEWLKTL